MRSEADKNPDIDIDSYFAIAFDIGFVLLLILILSFDEEFLRGKSAYFLEI